MPCLAYPLSTPSRQFACHQPCPDHATLQALHGGAIATLLDVAMATAGRSLHPDVGVITVSMTTHFLSSPKEGRVTAKGKVQRAGRSLVYCEGQVLDAQGALVATGIGTFMVRKEKPETPLGAFLA